jgi:hypothetical protein
MAVAIVLVAVILVGGLYLVLSKPVQQTIITTDGNNGQSQGTITTVSSGACDMQATQKPEIKFTLQNPLNTSATEFETTTVRFYDVTNGGEVFSGTLAGSASGMHAIGSGFSCECGHNYKVYAPASDGVVTSAVFNAECKGQNNPYEWTVAQQNGTIFKVYDENAKSWLYATTDMTAGAWRNSGSSFYSATSNSTGTAVGTDGYFIYSIYFEENASVAVDTQFEDQTFGIAINAGNLSIWAEPSSLYIQGAKITKLASVPSKISSDGYDFFYEVTEGSTPLHVGTTQRILTLETHAKGGVNPGAVDSVTVGLFTSGYFQKTLSSGMGLGYTKDDSSSTYVYTGQTAILVFS